MFSKKNNAGVVAHKWVRHFLSPDLALLQTGKDAYKAFIVKMIVKRLSYSRERIEEILGDVKLSLPDKVFNEDFSLKINEEDLLKLIYTPGHVPGEISVYHLKSQVLFAGDTFYEGMPLTMRFGGPKEWRQ